MQRTLSLACLVAGLVAAPLFSQNVTRLSRLDSYSAYSGIWGYNSPDGREFAIVGERNGLWIVETTDPTKPTHVAYFRYGNSSTWRDATVYNQFIYATSEGHGGLRVIDMSNPSKPADLGYTNGNGFGRHLR